MMTGDMKMPWYVTTVLAIVVLVGFWMALNGGSLKS
jgi:hypothetical protein